MNVLGRGLQMVMAGIVLAMGAVHAAEPTAATNAKLWRVSLATNGVPGVTIVCDTGNRFDQFAAQELQRCVQELTEVELAIVDVSERASVVGPCVYIGDTPFARMMGELSESLEPDSYRIRILPRSLIITAHNAASPDDDSEEEQDQAIVSAVYELIARLASIKWDEIGVLEGKASQRKRLVVSGSKPIQSTTSLFRERYVNEPPPEDVQDEGEASDQLSEEESEPAKKVPVVIVPAEQGGKRYANRKVLPHAFQSWCVSTDDSKLTLRVEKPEGDSASGYVMTDTADYTGEGKSVYYYVNWDLVGTPSEPGRIDAFRVEQDRLYLVHMYEIDAPNTLDDLGRASKAMNKAVTVAWVWIGRGSADRDSGGRVSSVDEGVGEIRETPEWFNFNPRERLPSFSRQFPRFALPEEKLFSVGPYSDRDQAKDYLARGVSHLRGAMADGYPVRRRAVTISDFFITGLDLVKSAKPQVTPSENTFIQMPLEDVVARMNDVKDFDYIFLKEDSWNANYQPGTLERLVAAIRQGKENYPNLKFGDVRAGIPYTQGFLSVGDSRTMQFEPGAVVPHYGLSSAVKTLDSTLTESISVAGKSSSYGRELSCLTVDLHAGPAYSHPVGMPESISESDLTVPTAIHLTRINRALPMNAGKPAIWFTSGFLEQGPDHPLVHYPTEVRNPSGVVLIKKLLQLSPDLCEAMGFFSFFEGNGCYIWDDAPVSQADSRNIFTLYHAAERMGAVPRLAEWKPEIAGTEPQEPTEAGYPFCLRFDVDYVALGAWKYSEVASICEQGERQDLAFSLDGGAEWIEPPADGSAMCQGAERGTPVVVGAVMDEQAAVAIYHPYQAADAMTSIQVKIGEREFSFEIMGKRVHVYRIDL